MVTAQTCIQLSFVLIEVQPLPHFLRRFIMAKYNHHRVWINSLCICEYAISLNDNGSGMTVSASGLKGIWNVRLPCAYLLFYVANSPHL